MSDKKLVNPVQTTADSNDQKNQTEIPSTTGSKNVTHNAWNIGGNQSSNVNEAGSEIEGRTSNTSKSKKAADDLDGPGGMS